VLIHADDLVIIPPARGQRIAIIGQVHSPRGIPFRSGLRLSDALALAGGATDVGDIGDIRVVRGPLSHPRVYRASVGALVRGEARDVMLEPGDVVMVTETVLGSMTDVLARLTPLLLIGNLARALSQ
jgi:polysaccharide export outer membrane protein